MEFDEQSIKQQLHDLHKERAEIAERLRNTDKSGRLLRPPVPPPPLEGPAGGPSSFERTRSGDRAHYGRGPPAGHLPGPPRHVVGEPIPPFVDGRRGRNDWGDRRMDGRRREREPEIEQAAPRKKILSAVIVDGEAKAPTAANLKPIPRVEAELKIAKRPAPSERAEDNPAAKKRNMRMFGALMGTLQRFKSDEAKNRDSEATKKREEALVRATVKAKETAVELRRKERRDMLLARLADVDRRRQLMFEFEIKRLELLFVQSVTRKAELAVWLKTKVGPPVCWAPAKFDRRTRRMQEEQRDAFHEWKDKQALRLREERAAIQARAKENAQRAEDRRQAIMEGRRYERFDRQNGHRGGPPGGARTHNSTAHDEEEDHNSEHEQAVEAEEQELNAEEAAGHGEDEMEEEPEVIDHEAAFDLHDRYQGQDDD